MDGEKGNNKRFHFGETSSLWYARFSTGCLARMDQDFWQDLVLRTYLIELVFLKCEEEITQADSLADGAKWVIVGFYLAISFILSLRGPEGFILEIKLL